MDHITLYLKDEKSDKVYQVAMEPEDDGYMVRFAYGRKGAKLTCGAKPDYAVEEEEARATFNKIVKEKTSKGYAPYEVVRPKWLDTASPTVDSTMQCNFTGPYSPKRWKNIGIKPNECCDDEENAENKTTIEPVDGDPSACQFTYVTADLGGIVRRVARFRTIADASGLVTFDYKFEVTLIECNNRRHYLRVFAEADQGAIEITPVNLYEEWTQDAAPKLSFEGSIEIPVVQGRAFGFVVGGSFCGQGVLQGKLTISNFSAPARADWAEGTSIPTAPTLFPTKLLPLTGNGLVIRTDFSDDAGWEQLKKEILEPNVDLDDLVADVHFVEDRCFEGLSADQLASTVHNGFEAWFLFVADQVTFTHPEHPVLVVDCQYEPGLACRILPGLVGITEVQISEQNADYDECTDCAAADGIVRN